MKKLLLLIFILPLFLFAEEEISSIWQEHRQEAATVRQRTRYAVAYDGDKVMHAIKVEPGQVIMTGLPYLKIFDTEEEAVKKFGVKFTEGKDEMLPE